MSVPFLRVEALHVTYRVRRRLVEAVKGVSFTIHRGQCLGVVGESGSGKSSLARAVLGLEPEAAHGSVEWDGYALSAQNRRERLAFCRKAQMVFQDPMGSLNPRLKVGAALAEVLKVHGLVKTRKEAFRQAAQWLETVGLDAAYADRFPHELSGGQRQRVNLARALCVGAEFLIADEPVSALDVSVQAQILNLLQDLQRQRGITWMLIGHDLAVMRYLADHLLVMKNGEVVECAPAEQVFMHPAHPYTRELLASVPHVDRGLARRCAL
ncbi:MAG: ATP-binding cassette domain-containing protein [Verrucomicrobiota bacterium]|jgi:ABC-type oligopeptide transport system ATPase subunit|nr:ATP-binding cassette domain-containing protein [Verrucomicrobiota bacterium]